MSKNLSLNQGFEQAIKKASQETVDEEKDQSFDQVSMGSLGAGDKVNKADLRYEKVMQDVMHSSNKLPSYLSKTNVKGLENNPASKTFFRPAQVVNSAQITQVIKPNQSYSPVKQWSQITGVMKIKPVLADKP
jgi:hypothetical protein